MTRVPLVRLAILTCLALLLVAPSVRMSAQEAEDPAHDFTEAEQAAVDKALRFERELVKIVDKVRPASVTIENWRMNPRTKKLVRASGGSGVIIDSAGYVFTNQHVVQGASELWVVLLDHRRLKAKLVGNVPRGDLALLKIAKGRLKRGDYKRANPGRLSPGEWVIATGNPFFLGHDGEAVVTLGVVSGLERILPGKFSYGCAIQHDARINPGNSGGPLWNSEGHLLGINGKIAMSGAGGSLGQFSSGAGYTIPVDQARNCIEGMLEGRSVKLGDELLGIQTKTHQDDDGTNNGAEVVKVTPRSPAAMANSGGIRTGDVIVKVIIRGKARHIRTQTELIARLSPLAEGSKLTVIVKRGYKRIVISNIKLVQPKKPGKGKSR